MSKDKLKIKETLEVSNWYKVELLANGITAIGEPYHFDDVFSYLVEGSDYDLLIDSGMGIVPIIDPLAMIRNSNKPLIALNTHAHYDHIGGNKYFPSVLIPNNNWEKQTIIEGWSHEKLEIYGFEKGFENYQGPSLDVANFQIMPYLSTIPALSEGYKFNLGGRILEVISTPGHTPGSISLIDQSCGVLFTSDLLYEGPLACSGIESSFVDFFDSLKRVKKLVDSGLVRKLHPGHNYSESKVELLDHALELFEECAKDREREKGFKNEKIVYSSNKSKRLKLVTKI